ncbi:hypothetical protein [Hahella chejuensis]|nr:hypothetical protein [Hahella chejuensis]
MKNSPKGLQYIALLSAFVLHACILVSRDVIAAPTYESEFRTLWLAHNGLEFPASESGLEDCKSANYQPCLDVVKRVQAAKKQLLAVSSQQGLSATLAAIHKYCLPDAENDAMAVCEGAISGLYFYASTNEDREIIDTVKAADKHLAQKLFARHYEWLYNRKLISEWQALVEQTALSEAKKDLVKERLSSKAVEKFGLMLVD